MSTSAGGDPKDEELDPELEAAIAASDALRAKAASTGKKQGPSGEAAARPEPAPREAKAAPGKDVPAASKALAKTPAPSDRLARITLVVAAALALVAAIAAPLELPLIAQTKVKGGLVAFFAALALLLSFRALLLRRRAALAVGPGLFAVVAASLALTAAGFLAFQERGAAMEAPEGAGKRAADLVAWEAGRAQQRSRDLAMSGGLAVPGFALGALALGLVIGARRKAGAELEKAAADAKAAKGQRRKMVAAGWSALLLGAAVFAAGLAVDVLAILAPVDAVPHPRLAGVRSIREKLGAHAWKELDASARNDVCSTLETALADETPIDAVREELPSVMKVADQCVTHRIEQLPKGMSCLQAAATLGATATTKLIHAEDRVKLACDGALRGD